MSKCSVPWELLYCWVNTDVNVCGVVYWGGGARTATERMCTVALGYTTIFLQMQIVQTLLSSTFKNRHIAHPYEWDIRFVVKTWRLFFLRNPCWTCIAKCNSIVLLCHREKLPDRRRHVHKWWHNEHDTSWESLQFNAAVTFSRKADESQINQTDWLIYQQAYFIGSRYRISFIYWSNTNFAIFTHIGQ